MKWYHLKLSLYSLLLLVACQSNQSEEKTASQEKDSDATSVDFHFEIMPEQTLTEQAIKEKILDKKYYAPADKSACACDSDNCFSQKVLMTHYFYKKNKTQALVIIGNSCGNAAHAQSGWCDAALLQQSDKDWVLTDFWSKVGGGDNFGGFGTVGNAFQIGRNDIGIEVAGSFMAQGATFETTSIIGYLDGEVKEVAKIPTYFDNFGAALEEKDRQCFCQSYAFRPMGDADIFTLLLVKKDCTNSDDEIGCSGQTLEEAAVEYDGDGYLIPESQVLF